MQYSDTTNENGIIQDVERKINMGSTWISSSTERLKEFTSYANEEMSRIWHKIWSVYAGWQYDDSNQTDLPQASTNLTAGTSKYSLPEEALTVKRIDVTDSNGNVTKNIPLLTEQMESGVDSTETGSPMAYRLLGDTIQLYPTPESSVTNGLKVFFDRNVTDFDYTDTTKKPGFASPYHELVSLGMAIRWLKIKNPTSNSLAIFRADQVAMMEELERFYNNRFEDITPVIRGQQLNCE